MDTKATEPIEVQRQNLCESGLYGANEVPVL